MGGEGSGGSVKQGCRCHSISSSQAPDLSYRKITAKQNQRHLKVGGLWALVRSNGFSVVGRDSGTTEPSPFSSFGPRHSSFCLLSHFFGLSFSAAALTFSEAEAQSSTFVPLSSFGPQDLSLLLLPGDGGLMGADRAPVCAQPLKRTVGMSKHFIDEAKP